MAALSPRDWSVLRLLFVLLGLLVPDGPARATVTAPAVSIQLPAQPGGRVSVDASFQPGALLRLEASADLGTWKEVGRLHDALYSYPDPELPAAGRRYYRIRASERLAADDWKNQILFPEEVFRPEGAWGSVRWVKFAILKDDPWRVYYQDSGKYPFHYEFATTRLAPFVGMSRPAFDAVSLRRANQQVVLGTVLYPPRANFVEYGVQFTGLDPYTPDEIARWFEAVKATVHAEQGAGAVYMPAFEQSETARLNAAAFAEKGIAVASPDRWLSASNHCYSTGWALGRLKYFPPAEIDAAFTDGRLLPQDILLTDGVPAETPMVAGIISLTPSTPNSHTAILAKSFGIPFVHLPDAEDRARVQQLAGRQVILRAVVEFDKGLVKVIDVGEGLEPAVEAELLALKEPAPIQYEPVAVFGAISASTQNLTPADIRFFGGKAANYGLLRRTIPNNCPEAIAFSFDLWKAFLDQKISGGSTLRAEIALRLAPHSTYPPQIAAMKISLLEIRNLIRNAAQFTPEQKQEIITALSGFTPGRKIRFRSSTNVEDSETFTGAGLYDSYSGCLLDDLDGDTAGPCACEASEPEERGVFRAIQRVYASFYNDNAFLERLRRGVKEPEVGMGVLVHHSFPDDEELANGVAALDYLPTSSIIQGNMVTQTGAESVTNPEGAALPEVVDTFTFNTSTELNLRQHSTRLPLGGHVMEWQTDYIGFIGLFRMVGDGYRQLFPGKSKFTLDFEYKKDVNLGLVVKQVREVPAAAPSAPVTSFIINDPTVWTVAQREAGDVFGNHRLKSIWNLQSVSRRLTPDTLAAGLYTTGNLNYISGSAVQTLSGPLAVWPGASHTADGTTNRWSTGNGPGLRTWELQNTLTTSVTGNQPPIFTATDFPAILTVTYATPVPVMDYEGSFLTTKMDLVVLEPRREVAPGSILVERKMDNGKGVIVETSFFWPEPPPTAGGYTAPLIRFERTRITGLTTQPIVLTGYYSQTYRPGHHNFTEEFIFEPRLDPGVPAATLAELAAANIVFLHVAAGFDRTDIVVAGPDQQLRRL